MGDDQGMLLVLQSERSVERDDDALGHGAMSTTSRERGTITRTTGPLAVRHCCAGASSRGTNIQQRMRTCCISLIGRWHDGPTHPEGRTGRGSASKMRCVVGADMVSHASLRPAPNQGHGFSLPSRLRRPVSRPLPRVAADVVVSVRVAA
jgi:hypothetical protein